MSDFLFPTFEVYLANGTRLSKTEYASSSLGFNAGYGQALAVTLTIVGNDAVFLEEVGDLEEGAVLTEVYAGYRSDEMVLIGKNLLIWDTLYSYDAKTGSELKVTAYGCSQLLRQSGQRTTKLTSKTYADAAKEVADRWGLTIGIGSGAYRAFQETSAAFKTQPDAIQEVGDKVTPTPYQPASTGISSDPNEPLPFGNTKVAAAALRVANGVRIPSLTSDTITDFELCAQFARQVVEYGLGLAPGSWNVAARAYTISRSHQHAARFAVDYEQATRDLKLDHGGDPEPGDIVLEVTYQVNSVTLAFTLVFTTVYRWWSRTPPPPVAHPCSEREHPFAGHRSRALEHRRLSPDPRQPQPESATLGLRSPRLRLRAASRVHLAQKASSPPQNQSRRAVRVSRARSSCKKTRTISSS